MGDDDYRKREELYVIEAEIRKQDEISKSNLILDYIFDTPEEPNEFFDVLVHNSMKRDGISHIGAEDIRRACS